MLKIFKNYSYKTSILDDFEFYENRQMTMQDRRSKLPNPSVNHPSVIVSLINQNPCYFQLHVYFVYK